MCPSIYKFGMHIAHKRNVNTRTLAKTKTKNEEATLIHVVTALVLVSRPASA